MAISINKQINIVYPLYYKIEDDLELGAFLVLQFDIPLAVFEFL